MQIVRLTAPFLPTVIKIGTSFDNNTKIVGEQGVQSCNSHPHNEDSSLPDRFETTVDLGRSQIRVRRLDSRSGWGQDLFLRCEVEVQKSVSVLLKL